MSKTSRIPQNDQWAAALQSKGETLFKPNLQLLVGIKEKKVRLQFSFTVDDVIMTAEQALALARQLRQAAKKINKGEVTI
jgi:hypothetical protein